jgi:putative endonuclease
MTVWFDARSAFAGAAQLELPLAVPNPMDALLHARQSRGQMAYLSGLAAENTVERVYLERGLTMMARRWRGARAEIDMILADAATVVFVEVKKSRSFDTAVQSFGKAQRLRILQAAEEYLGQRGLSQMTEMRFDLALVNAQGAIDIIENAFCEGD